MDEMAAFEFALAGGGGFVFRGSGGFFSSFGWHKMDKFDC